MSFAFNIPFKVERGESMKTVKAISSCTTADKIFDCFPPECSGKTLVLVSAVGGGVGVNNQVMVVYGQTWTNHAGTSFAVGLRYRVGLLAIFYNLSNNDCCVNVGDEYAVLDTVQVQ